MKLSTDSRFTILVIDNEPEALQRTSGVLTAAGHRCTCAHDTQAAVEAVRSTVFDLIITDVNLAGQSGLWLCDQLKQHPAAAEVPVMFLSAMQGPDIIRRCHANGGTYYLRKPFDADVLLQLIEKAVRVTHLTVA